MVSPDLEHENAFATGISNFRGLCEEGGSEAPSLALRSCSQAAVRPHHPYRSKWSIQLRTKRSPVPRVTRCPGPTLRCSRLRLKLARDSWKPMVLSGKDSPTTTQKHLDLAKNLRLIYAAGGAQRDVAWSKCELLIRSRAIYRAFIQHLLTLLGARLNLDS
jgi:hypothetical protein